MKKMNYEDQSRELWAERCCACVPLQGKNALFRDLTSIQLMPSEVMDSGLILSRQEVPPPHSLKDVFDVFEPRVSCVVCALVPVPGPERLGAGSGWGQQQEALVRPWC